MTPTRLPHRIVALATASLIAALAGCASRQYIPPANGTATLVARAPDALLADGVMEVLIYPEGCPIGPNDQGLVLGRVSPRKQRGQPAVFRVPGDRPIVLQAHFMQGKVNCRAHMEVVLKADGRYELRSDLKRVKGQERSDPANRALHQPDAQMEYICAFGILGVRSTGNVKPGGTRRPVC